MESKMAGRFEGLSDLEWKLFEDIFPTFESRLRGMPPVPFRYVFNSLLYILITGCRWCDLPRGDRWAFPELSDEPCSSHALTITNQRFVMVKAMAERRNV